MSDRAGMSDVDLLVAIDAAVGADAVRADLVDAAVRRGLLASGLDAEWDTVRAVMARRMSEIGVPEEVLASLRPSARLVRDPDGTSQLGGRPRLDVATPWPHRHGRPLDHVAQIDLAALPPAMHTLGMPRRGLLTYFHDLEEMDRGRGGWGYEWPADLGASVLLLVPTEAARRSDWPAGLPVERRFEGAIVRSELVADVESVASETLPTRMPWAVRESLDEHVRPDGPDHKVLGVGVELQGPPLHVFPTTAKNSTTPPPGSPDIRATSADDWRLVLQLDTEVGDGLGWLWSDTGLLFVGVRHDDLLAGRFDRCWAVVIGT